MELQKVKDWVDLVLKGLSIVALIATGIWALYQFEITDTTASNIQTSFSTEVLKYSDDNRLLVLHFKVKNIGKVPVNPEHVTISVKDIPEGLKPSVVDIQKLKERYKEDIKKRYPMEKDGYVLEPGVEYDELVTLIVPKGTYAIRGEMDLGEDTEVDQDSIARVE